jgi:hypothetical protein
MRGQHRYHKNIMAREEESPLVVVPMSV